MMMAKKGCNIFEKKNVELYLKIWFMSRTDDESSQWGQKQNLFEIFF